MGPSELISAYTTELRLNNPKYDTKVSIPGGVFFLCVVFFFVWFAHTKKHHFFRVSPGTHSRNWNSFGMHIAQDHIYPYHQQEPGAV